MLLALSTTTPRCSVALFDGSTCLAQRDYRDARRHAERLLLEIDALCSHVGSNAEKKIDAVACDVGPGSFAGTRIGLATAKGVALARRIPLYGVQSLEAMALAAFDSNAAIERVACFVDAKRNEWFYSLFAREQPPGDIVNIPKVADPTQLFSDDGLWLCGEVLPDVPRKLDAQGCAGPDAYWIGRAAMQQDREPSLAEAAILEPSYVRAPDATKPAKAPDFRLRTLLNNND